MKVAVVGGGSTYTPELVEGLLARHEQMAVTEIALIDIDRHRLDVLGPLTRRMAEVDGRGVRISWGIDLDDGIRDSTFVVSQIRVGGQAARDRDELLGREFGLIGQETVGVGGFAKALRTIPVALRIAESIRRVAPDAVLFNFTNPAGLITEALHRHGGVHTVGLCNVPWNFKAEIGKAFGAPAADVELDYVGLNHLSWVRRVTIRGVDQTGAVLAGLRAITGEAMSSDDAPAWTKGSLDLVGALPNDYLLYYFETEAWVRHQAARPTRASEVMDIERSLLDQYSDPLLDHKPAELEQRGGAYYSAAAAALMADLWTDAGTVHVVNTANCGAIPNMADDVVVETAAVVRRSGVTPVPTDPLRPDVAALMGAVKEFELLTVQAAVEGDDLAARRALLCNPLGPPAHRVDEVWGRLRDVHAGWLGALDA